MFSLCVQAALATLASTELTLEAAVARAREQAPEVQLARLGVAEAEATAVGAGVPLPTNPRLFGEYRPLAIELAGQPTEPRHGYLVGVDGQVEISGAGATRLREAGRRVDAAKAELALEQTRVAARASRAFLEAQLADALVRSLDASRQVQERVEAAARERVGVGMAGEPELSAVRVELSAVRLDAEDARRRQHAARMTLRQLLDLSADETLTLAPLSSELSEAPRAETLLARALERRPELKSLRARLELLQATDDRLAREAIPKLGVTLGLDAAPASPVFAMLGLSIELPVAQRNQGPRAVASAQRSTEEARLAAELRRVHRDVALVRGNYESRRSQLALLTDEALPASRRTEALVETGWRAGRFDVFRLTAATRETLRLERQRLETLLAAWNDLVELKLVSGELAP